MRFHPIGGGPNTTKRDKRIEDKLAALVREHLDMELVYRVTGLT